MNTPMIAHHKKSELRGWREIQRHPADWAGWNTADRNMIAELLTEGHMVVTIGWDMYQVVKPTK